jgi:uncharacterized membrane protein
MEISLRSMLIAMIAIFIVDLVWLNTVGLYALEMTKRIQGSAVVMRFGPAIVVYIALAYLLLQANTVTQAALTGLATYAVYDMTSYSILKDYDPRIAIADTLWGGALFTIVYTVLRITKLV